VLLASLGLNANQYVLVNVSIAIKYQVIALLAHLDSMDHHLALLAQLTVLLVLFVTILLVSVYNVKMASMGLNVNLIALMIAHPVIKFLVFALFANLGSLDHLIVILAHQMDRLLFVILLLELLLLAKQDFGEINANLIAILNVHLAINQQENVLLVQLDSSDHQPAVLA